MRLSRTIAYAIQATLYLARAAPGSAVPCSEIARSEKMPERFLLQVLRSLVTHGILRSTRGVEGGYSLARPPDEITLDEVVRAFDNPLVPEVPNLEGQSEKMRACLLETLQSTSRAAFQELHNLSIGQLVASCDEN